MAKTKLEKIAAIEAQQEQLENRKKKLIQEQKAQERKDRTKRLCARMGFFESMLPATIPLTEEQFKIFLEKTILTESARYILDKFTAENAAAAPRAEETTARDNAAPAAGSTKAAAAKHAKPVAETADTGQGGRA